MIMVNLSLFAPSTIIKNEAGNIVKFIILSPIEMFIGSVIYAGLGLGNTILMAGISNAVDYISFERPPNIQSETQLNNSELIIKDVFNNLKNDYKNYSPDGFILEHFNELPGGALMHVFLEKISSKKLYELILSVEDKFNPLKIDTIGTLLVHNSHLVYDYAHTGAHIKAALVDPIICIMYDKNSFLDCVLKVLNEPKEHLFTAINYYVEVPYSICQYTSEQVALLFENPSEEGIGYYDEL